MGLEITHKCTPSFRRSWEKARQDLVENNLFTQYPELRGQTFRLTANAGNSIAMGEELLVRHIEGELIAYRGNEAIGVFNNPPAPLLEAIRNAGLGAVCGKVEKIHEISGAADIIIVP